MYEADSSSPSVSSSTSPPYGGENKVISQSDLKGKDSVEKISSDDLPEQSNKLSSTGTEQPKKKSNELKKICGVCGDIAKSFHFGGVSCDSCKAFFRRSVHHESYTGFRCAYNSRCEVEKGTRKACQFCRYQKCLRIGMEPKWVMGEEERKQLKEKKVKKPEGVTENEYEPDVGEMLKHMTSEEKNQIECIVNKYQHSYREIPFLVSQCQGSRNTIEIIQMFTTILRRFAYFTKLLPEFTQLSILDQSTLLRAGVLEMCLLRGALSYDLKNNRWPAADKMTFLKDCPQLRVEDMKKLVSEDLYDMHMQFINGIQELGADEPTVTLLLLIVLFYPDRGSLENQQCISQVQEKYLLLLKKYVGWRYGPKGAKTFPKLLSKLADLRQLNDSHTEYNLRMSQTEVERIQEQLGTLNLNPYPQWVLVEDQLSSKEQQKELHEQMLQQVEFVAHGQHMQPQLGSPVMGGQQMTPQPRDFFMQFVNRKIPALVNNPFTQFPIENELAYARSFFQQAPASHNEGMNMSMDGGDISQFKNILESTDQNSLKNLKDSLSPQVLAKLQSVFGNSAASESPMDMNNLPPEFRSYMAQNQNHQVPTGIPEFTEPHHPMAQYTHSQLADHFNHLQQQFRNPNYYYEQQQMPYYPPSAEYLQPSYGYSQQPSTYPTWQ